MKYLSVLGVTGSIGSQTLDLIRKAPDKYKLISCACSGSNLPEVINIIQEFSPEYIYIHNSDKAQELRELINSKNINILSSQESSLRELVEINKNNITDVVIGVTGIWGLEPTLEALKHNINVIIANKETIICGNHLIKEALKTSQSKFISADSEHVAIQQCLEGISSSNYINKVYLTASGGPFWNSDIEPENITIEQALNHPTWSMGSKISIDSATMMNKGFEIIEARELFNIDYTQLDILIHPQSVIHGLIEQIDGSILSAMAPNNMRIPLQYAIDYPEINNNISGQSLDLTAIHQLEFFPVNKNKFPCVELAYEAGRDSILAQNVLVFADEYAVSQFLQKNISFADIPIIINKALEKFSGKNYSLKTAQDIICLEQEVYKHCRELL